MYPGKWAKTNPEKPALIMADTGESLSYGDLEDRSLRLANDLRARGLTPGDHISVIAENRFEVVEAMWAALRSGLLVTTVNSHLTPAEVAYIVADSEAKAVILSAGLRDAQAIAEAVSGVEQRIGIAAREDVPQSPSAEDERTAAGEPASAASCGLPGFEEYEAVLAAASPERPASEPVGSDMLYSSGTTGHPKGIVVQRPEGEIDTANVMTVEVFTKAFGLDDSTVYLSPAPLYHSAPLRMVRSVIACGGTAVVMPKFDPEASLGYIEKYGITHSQWVPTMFVRMLKLPADVRERYDVSTLRLAVHVAAPCPIEVKEQMIEWWGPIIVEYFAATESNGMTLIRSADALSHPGSVGKSVLGPIRICGPDGEVLPNGEVGTVYFEPLPGREPFEYFKDPEKTAKSRHPDHPDWSTVGDLGYVDEDGYLFLADRGAFLIITGGVNIYPQEIENALALHPDIADVAVVGRPDDELGEIAVAVVQPAEHVAPGTDLSESLREFLAPKLARFKIPRRFVTVDELPRTPTGKLVKRRLDGVV